MTAKPFIPGTHIVPLSEILDDDLKLKPLPDPKVLPVDQVAQELTYVLRSWASHRGLDMTFIVSSLQTASHKDRGGSFVRRVMEIELRGENVITDVELAEKGSFYPGTSLQTQLEKQVADLKLELLEEQDRVKHLREQLKHNEAKQEEQKEERLIKRLQAKVKASFGPKHQEILEDFLQWLTAQKGLNFLPEAVVNFDLGQMVANVQGPKVGPVEVLHLVEEYLSIEEDPE